MSELPLVAGLFLVNPPAFILARLVGSAVALFFNRRQRGVKLALNLAQFSLASVVSVGITHAIVPSGSAFGPPVWAAILLVEIAGVTMYVAVLALERALIPWHPSLRGEEPS